MINDFYFRMRLRTRKCRFCGKTFKTPFPARKTCEAPECRAKSEALIKEQNKAADARYKARKRRSLRMHAIYFGK